MKKGRFLWSAYRITEKQKAGKARNIKEKQLKNSRNTVSKLLVEHLSSPNDNQTRIYMDLRSIMFLGSFLYMIIVEKSKKSAKIFNSILCAYNKSIEIGEKSMNLLKILQNSK